MQKNISGRVLGFGLCIVVDTRGVSSLALWGVLFGSVACPLWLCGVPSLALWGALFGSVGDLPVR